jgi:transcription elongation factor GreA
LASGLPRYIKEKGEAVSQVIKEKLQGELDELESELRIHLPKEIKRALEFGDLRENSEYKAALDRQNMVKARIVELRQRISEIASIDPSKVPRDKASYGSTLVLYDAEKDEEVTYRLVTPEESDPAQGLISTTSTGIVRSRSRKISRLEDCVFPLRVCRTTLTYRKSPLGLRAMLWTLFRPSTVTP